MCSVACRELSFVQLFQIPVPRWTAVRVKSASCATDNPDVCALPIVPVTKCGIEDPFAAKMAKHIGTIVAC